jgi:hypothetical protein
MAGDTAELCRGDAVALLARIERILDAEQDCVVVLDFDGVGRITHDAIDELMAPLFDRLGETLPDRVFLDGCAASVLADLREIAEADRPEAGSRFVPEQRGRHAA